MRAFVHAVTITMLALLFLSPDAAIAKNSKEIREMVQLCHVGNEVGPNGETYDPNCVPNEENEYFCADAGKIDLILIPRMTADKHLANPSHAYAGISDYDPLEKGASGVGQTDDDDSDYIDEGCEFERTGERTIPCVDRTDYYDCRPWDNEACIIGTAPCECNWDAEVSSPFTGAELCPGTNEEEPKDSSCITGQFCKPIPCEERVMLSQCRPDSCAIAGICQCQWDAVNIGFEGDVCAGSNEDDPCTLQIAGREPFCTSLLP